MDAILLSKEKMNIFKFLSKLFLIFKKKYVDRIPNILAKWNSTEQDPFIVFELMEIQKMRSIKC